MNISRKRIGALLFLSLFFLSSQAVAAAIEEQEAMAVADYWYSAEITSGHLKMTPAEKEERLRLLAEHQIFYLTAGTEDLLSTRPEKEEILAYIVKYKPSGYVVVSGEDMIEPIIAFAVESDFRWDQPDKNFMRHFLNRDLGGRWRRVRSQKAGNAMETPHPNWTKLRSLLPQTGVPESSVPMDGPEGTTYLLLETALWDQGTYYNDEVLSHNGNISGIPTGCTATAMAIKMRFHSWPLTGNSSRSYADTWGSVQYSHSRNFGTSSYNWASMPETDLTATNSSVANLMYDCGVAVAMDYEVGGSGAWPSATNTNNFFRYKGTVERTSSHDDPIRDSVLAYLPVVISSSAHTVVVSGYRDTLTPYYFINAGWGGSGNGWYSLTSMPGGDSTIDRSYPYSSPNNYIYVDSNWSSTENGNMQNPFNTISEGAAQVPDNGQLWIKSGTYSGSGNVPITLNSRMTVQAYAGSVTIN